MGSLCRHAEMREAGRCADSHVKKKALFWTFHPEDKVVAQLRRTEGLREGPYGVPLGPTAACWDADTSHMHCAEESILIAVTFTSTLTPHLIV